MTPLTTVAIASALALSLVAAITDVRTGIIPNSLTLPPIVLAASAYGASGGIRAMGLSLLAACVCGLVPYALFRARAMGGGDVKLFAALGALHGHDLTEGLRIQVLSFAVASLAVLCACCTRRSLRTVVRQASQGSRQLLRGRRPLPTLGNEGLGQLRLGGFVLLATLLQGALLLARESIQ